MPNAYLGNGKHGKVHALGLRKDGSLSGYTYCARGSWLYFDQKTDDPVTCKSCLAEMARRERKEAR